VKQLLEWFTSGKVKPVISERVPLAQTATAMAHLMQRKVMGKVVILPEA
jgi:NADPH2:quinone reductase